MNKLQRMSAIAGLGVAICALVGCGGGGGDPAVDTNPPPAGGGGGGTAVNPGLTGSFYFTAAGTDDMFRVDAATGVRTPLLRGSTSRHFVYVSPDGSRYAEAINDSVVGQENSEYMVLSVYETATKKLLTKLQFDGFAASFKFSPDNRFLAAIRYPDLVTQGTLAESGLAILDLADPANPKAVVDFSRTGSNVVFGYDWLPGNQFIYLRRDRTLVTGSALVQGGNEVVTGTLQVPTDLSVARPINASPDGTKLLLNYTWTEGDSRTDVWISAIDGTGSQRFSTGNYGQGASWSPDGKYIVLSTDAGWFAQGGASTFYCKRWYAPSSARGVYEGSPESRPVQYLESGKAAVMPCSGSASYLY
jgi:dipeptidyl aminopeptidase/acylaminoacyl peptidase